MYNIIQQIVVPVLIITWLGGAVVLYFRFRAKRNVYLQRFENRIDFFAGDPIFYPGSARGYQDTVRVMREQQPDAELEGLRREMLRRFRYCMIWIFGFPIIAAGVVALLILTSLSL